MALPWVGLTGSDQEDRQLMIDARWIFLIGVKAQYISSGTSMVLQSKHPDVKGGRFGNPMRSTTGT